MSARFLRRSAALAFIAFALTSLSAGAAAVPSPANSVVKLAKIAIPGKPLKAFDISWVDAPTGRYYLADRTNASIDVVDTTTNSIVTQITGGFKGATGKNTTSGPDGIVVTVSGSELWAGDGDSSVKVVDLKAGAIVASVSTGGKFRADELAYDPKDNVILIANDADDPPFLTFISVGTRSVLKKIEFPDATDGLEQPVYDPVTGMFFQAVPASKTNEGGAVAVLDPVGLSLVNTFPLTNCVPHGMAVGPGTQLLAGCSVAGRTVVIDRTNGKTLAEFSDNGGSDEAWYNPGDNKYYLAQSAAQNLGVIDAGTWASTVVQSGVGAHSAAADQALNHVFVPVAAPDPACPNGCIAVFTTVAADMKGVSRLR